MSDQCEWKGCSDFGAIGYTPDLKVLASRSLCSQHWQRLAAAEPQSRELFRALRKLGHSSTEIRGLFKTQRENFMASTTTASKGSKVRTRKSPAKKPISRSKGKSTGLSIRQYWASAFERNMKVGVGSRLTDLQIQQAARVEFPGRTANDFSNPANIRRIRREFNEAWWATPSGVSFEFDAQGFIVPPSIRRDSKNVPNSQDYQGKTEQTKLRTDLTKWALDAKKEHADNQ